jgi:hypothetical protein
LEFVSVSFHWGLAQEAEDRRVIDNYGGDTMRTSRSIAITVALFGLSSQASATTIIDTINGAPFVGVNGYTLCNNCNTSDQAVGLEFNLASPTTIRSVDAYIFEFKDLSAAVTLGIMSNASGSPSGSFISGDSSNIMPGAGPINLTSLNWSLAAGTYWLVAVANVGSSLAWQGQTNTGFTWAFTFTGDGTSGWNNTSLLPVPMALISDVAVPSVPLPAAFPLFATGLGALGLLGWRRKRKQLSAA